MSRPTALLLCFASCFCAGAAHAAPDFGLEYDRLDGLRRSAILNERYRDAGRLSDEIGDLYLAYDRGAATAADNYMKAGGFYSEAARGSKIGSVKANDYNAALAAYADAKRGYEAANAKRTSTLFQRQAAAAEKAIAALKAEMTAAGVAIKEPPPPAPPQPPPVIDTVDAIPYRGPSVTTAVDLYKQRFDISVPTVFEIEVKLRDTLAAIRQPFAKELGKANGVIARNYLVAAAMNELDKDPLVRCEPGTAPHIKNEKVLLNDKVPACFISIIKVGHSPMTRSNAVQAQFILHFQLDKAFFRLSASATLETQDPETPKLLGAVEYMARSLRLADPAAAECNGTEEQHLSAETKTVELSDDQSKVFYKVSKDNDDGVAAAQGMATFWKAGTAVMELITHVLPPAAGKSGHAVGFVIDYLKKGGEILDRVSTSWIKERANEVKAELYVVTWKFETTCESYKKCHNGKWVPARRATTKELGESGHRAVKRASKDSATWVSVEAKSNPDLVDPDKIEVWSETFLASELAKLKARKLEYDGWLAACR